MYFVVIPRTAESQIEAEAVDKPRSTAAEINTGELAELWHSFDCRCNWCYLVSKQSGFIDDDEDDHDEDSENDDIKCQAKYQTAREEITAGNRNYFSAFAAKRRGLL